MSKELLSQAEIAMGSSQRILDAYRFTKRLGWLTSIESIEKRAASNPDVKKLIWC